MEDRTREAQPGHGRSGLMLGRKQHPNDTDLYFWRAFMAEIGDAEELEFLNRAVRKYEEDRGLPLSPPLAPMPAALPPGRRRGTL